MDDEDEWPIHYDVGSAQPARDDDRDRFAALKSVSNAAARAFDRKPLPRRHPFGFRRRR